ncbi:MAG: tRNA (cmo5U34)-methyltransferase [Cryomorphaceae bacterium]|jgi:tRNA (cmo5U34)-methyltransferase
MSSNKDRIYKRKSAAAGSFTFDKKVADVFSDMISRSVPGYLQILELLPTLVRQFKQADANYYDLGCSLGAGMCAMAEGLDEPARIIGVDNSAAMLKQANLIVHGLDAHNFELREQDLSVTSVENAALVLMNFTLQFISIDQRKPLIDKIYTGLNPGGALVLSEKIKFEDSKTNALLIDVHHQYKADQGYSELEIAQKRDAIENVLIPETLECHTQRLSDAGFSVITPWVQNLQFISILAVK